MRRRRLDAELVRRGLARSRELAGSMVEAGRVSVGGQLAAKAATAVTPDVAITVHDDEPGPVYVSRGAYKLLAALREFEPSGLAVTDRRCLDAGASTGGFTDVLLHRGAGAVIAVDVGYGQLAWSLRSRAEVTVLERTNVRALRLDQVGEPVELVVADLSFISLGLVLPALHAVSVADADFVLMVKPQFEVGKDQVGRGGVVRDPGLRAKAVRQVAAAGAELGLGVRGVVASPLPGPAGNVEYFLWLRHDAGELTDHMLAAAMEKGPT